MIQRTPAGWLLASGLLLLAQMNAPGASTNLGVPSLSGTRTPEQNPATAMPSPPSPSPPAPPASNASAPPALGSSEGPAYSFGAAPPPVTAPSR
jgi:hypothetical protein